MLVIWITTCVSILHLTYNVHERQTNRANCAFNLIILNTFFLLLLTWPFKMWIIFFWFHWGQPNDDRDNDQHVPYLFSNFFVCFQCEYIHRFWVCLSALIKVNLFVYQFNIYWYKHFFWCGKVQQSLPTPGFFFIKLKC